MHLLSEGSAVGGGAHESVPQRTLRRQPNLDDFKDDGRGIGDCDPDKDFFDGQQNRVTSFTIRD